MTGTVSRRHGAKTGSAKMPNRRPRPLPPDVTARNLAIEKKRREALNGNLLDLARLVPALAAKRRLSKVLIINESIRHFRQQRGMCIAAAQDMQYILAENSRLMSEVNTLRSELGVSLIPHAVPKPITEAMAQLMSVKDDVLGEFPAGFGDNWASNSQEAQPTSADSIWAEPQDLSSLPEDWCLVTDSSQHTQWAHPYQPEMLPRVPSGLHSGVPPLEQGTHASWDLTPSVQGHSEYLFTSFPELAESRSVTDKYISATPPNSIPEPSNTMWLGTLTSPWAQRMGTAYDGPCRVPEYTDACEQG